MITTKQLTAVLAVTALLAVGVIGVGYAYTASTSNSDNEVDTAFLTLTPGSGLEADFSKAFKKDIRLDTVVQSNGLTGDDFAKEIIYSITEEDLVDGAKYAGVDVDCADLGKITLNVDKAESLAMIPAYDLKISIPETALTAASCTYYAYTTGTAGTMSKFVDTGDNYEAIIPQAEGVNSVEVHVAVQFNSATTAVQNVLAKDTILSFKADTEVYEYAVIDVDALHVTDADTSVSYKTGETIATFAAAVSDIKEHTPTYIVELKNGLAQTITTGVTPSYTALDAAVEPAAGADVSADVTFTINSMSDTVTYTITNSNDA